MTKLTGIIMSENKLTGSLGVRNEINVDIIGTGARGKEGKSAYETWLDLGNEGTEQEYLASLKGDPFTYEDFTEDQAKKLSGVYVGSGEMPEGYYVQIDPGGEANNRYYFGTENAGELIYVGEAGYSIGLTIGSGLKIVDGVLMLDGTVTPDTGEDEATAVLGKAKLGTMVLGSGG